MHLRRRTVRLFAAGVAGLMAVIYVLIGLGVLDISGTTNDREFLIVFGAMAASAFLFGALLLVRFDRRWLWALGLAFQVFVIWAYVVVSKQRTPPFETWGILLRVLQVPLIAALAYLAFRPLERGSQVDSQGT